MAIQFHIPAHNFDRSKFETIKFSVIVHGDWSWVILCPSVNTEIFKDRTCYLPARVLLFIGSDLSCYALRYLQRPVGQSTLNHPIDIEVLTGNKDTVAG